MLLTVDLQSSIPIYQQIRNQIIAQVAAGLVRPGEKLPTIRALANQLQVNLHTVNKAYQQLAQEGFIDLLGRRGAIVVQPSTKNLQQTKKSLQQAVTEAVAQGVSCSALQQLVIQTYQQLKAEKTV
ncbi:GntR family transcriptional regulator [Liquorilactobacillus vini]|uniref:GntR family transcriptional regulator n=1 Tax=Liquorilactobacillus vini TaxID=238015 RepID=UPI0003141CC5|nr:GntR family transcriptional regulator [Liquorilactobacillus vini]